VIDVKACIDEAFQDYQKMIANDAIRYCMLYENSIRRKYEGYAINASLNAMRKYLPELLLKNVRSVGSKYIPFNYITESTVACYDTQHPTSVSNKSSTSQSLDVLWQKNYFESNEVETEKAFLELQKAKTSSSDNIATGDREDRATENTLPQSKTLSLVQVAKAVAVAKNLKKGLNKEDTEIVFHSILDKFKLKDNNLNFMIFTVINTTDGSIDKKETGGAPLCAYTNGVCANDYEITLDGAYAPYSKSSIDTSARVNLSAIQNVKFPTPAPTNIKNKMLTNNPPSVPYINTSDLKFLAKQLDMNTTNINAQKRISTFLTNLSTYPFYNPQTTVAKDDNIFHANAYGYIWSRITNQQLYQIARENLTKLIQSVEKNNEATLIGTANFVNLTQIPQSFLNPVCLVTTDASVPRGGSVSRRKHRRPKNVTYRK
jgi:hypothetical protein